MPLREDYLPVKGRLKRGLGISSTNASSTSAGQGNRPSRSQSPMPDTVPQSQPQPRTLDDIKALPSDDTYSPPDPSSLTLVDPIPATLPALVVSASSAISQADQTPRPIAPSITANEKPGTTFERTKAVARPGLKTLLQMVESNSDVFPPLGSATASQGRKEFEELITTLCSLVEDTGGYVSRAGPGMTNSVKNLWIGLDKELKLAEGKYHRGGTQRFAEALDDPEEIAKCHQRIHGHLERLALNANLGMWEMLNESAMETRLRGLLPALSAVYNSAESEKVRRRECTPGTREKELEKLLEWACNKSPEAEDVYWMNGMAGTGKTTIACSLCAELEASSMLGASFFCSRLLPECRDVSLIVPCIAYQLARFSNPYCHELLNVLKDDPDVHTRVLKTQFERLLANPLYRVKNTLPTDFVIVIDALDECDSEDSVGQILDLLLSQTTNSTLPVRFLLSSRPESKIYQKMMARVGHNFEARLILHDLDAEAVKWDIQTYLKAELTAIDLTSDQLTKLVDLSGALFIFASTTARYIVEGIEFMEVEERLAMVLGLSKQPTKDKDRAIDQLYTSILQAVFQKETINKQTWMRLKSLLDIVICAQEPMTTDGLAGLLGEKSGKHVEVLLRQLSSVLDIGESTGLITALHASFPDYMLDPARSLSFHCDPLSTHTRLAHACFNTIVKQKADFNICSAESSYLLDDEDPELGERVSKMVLPHLFYGCRYWITHLELSGESDGFRKLLWDFLSKWLLLWMEVLNVKKCIHLGPSIIQRAEGWSRNNAYPEETTELAHDAWRFVTMYAGHAVSQSTPHIYVSMLPFWPSSSPISKHYHSRMHNGVQVQGAAVTRRRLLLLATWIFGDTVHAVCFSPDGSLIALGVSSSIYIIDSITGRTVLGPLTHDDIVRAAAFSPGGTLLATGSEDRSIRVWGTTDGDLVWQALEAHAGYVISLSFLPSSTRLVSGGGDCLLRVWATDTGDIVLGPIAGHTGAVASVSVSPDGTHIASGSADKTLRVWNVQTGEMVLGPFEGHVDGIRSVSFSPDGTRLVSGSRDNTVRVWSNLSGPTTAYLLQGHTDVVTSVAFSPNGKYIVSGSRDHTLRLWAGNTNLYCVAILWEHLDAVISVAFSFDSTRIVSGSCDKTIRVWDAQTHDPTTSLSLDGYAHSVTSISVSRDGRHILSGSGDKTLRIQDALNGQLFLGPFKGHTGWINCVCFSPCGTWIVSCSVDQTVRWWDAHSGTPVHKPVNGHTDIVWSICFSPNGCLVASCSEDQTIQLWNTQTHEAIGSPIEGHTESVRSVCFSPDGLKLISGSLDQTVIVWDVESRQRALPPLQGHTWGVTSVHISPDGARIVSGSWDNTVRLWDAHTGEVLLSPLYGHSAVVFGVNFSHDGRYIVSCSRDKSLRIWNVQTGEAVGSLLGHTGDVRSCCFLPCGRRIVSGSKDRTLRAWEVADLVPQGSEVETNQPGFQSIDQSPSPYFSWHPQNDGWVVDSHDRLLVWVPPDLRHALMFPRNTFLVSTEGSFQLEFDPAKLGERWADNYTA